MGKKLKPTKNYILFISNLTKVNKNLFHFSEKQVANLAGPLKSNREDGILWSFSFQFRSYQTYALLIRDKVIPKPYSF